jgi:hypothetical protein
MAKEENTLAGWAKVIADSARQTSIHNFENADCIKCNQVEKHMTRVGAIVFCDNCVKEEFDMNDLNPVKNQKEKYREWLKVYNEKEV